MRTTTLVATIALSLVGCAQAPGGGPAAGGAGGGKADGTAPSVGQSAAAIKTEAATVLWLLDQTQATAISCTASGGDEIRIEKGNNPEDETGLVLTSKTGDHSYGTDQIQEMFARSNLLVQWGEEGNYQLVISNWAWILFNYDGTETPALDDSITAVGAVMSESEQAETVTCKVIH